MNSGNMNNGKVKSLLARRTLEWDLFLKKIIEEINLNGYDKKIWETEIERLILRHKLIFKIAEDIVHGFQGVKEIREEVEQWMKGK